jgi:hypothetical protein
MRVARQNSTSRPFSTPKVPKTLLLMLVTWLLMVRSGWCVDVGY